MQRLRPAKAEADPELPEIIRLSTRVLVLRGGRLVGELPRAQVSQEALLRLMAGLPSASPAPAPAI